MTKGTSTRDSTITRTMFRFGSGAGFDASENVLATANASVAKEHTSLSSRTLQESTRAI